MTTVRGTAAAEEQSAVARASARSPAAGNRRLLVLAAFPDVPLAALIASTALVTICAAREQLASSFSFASRSSAFARMIPSWLFNRWKRAPQSVGCSIWNGSVDRYGNGTWLRIASAGPWSTSRSHRDGRCAWLTRHHEENYPQHVTEEQRRPPGCGTGRMQRDFHHRLPAKLRLKPPSVSGAGAASLAEAVLTAPLRGAEHLRVSRKRDPHVTIWLYPSFPNGLST